METTSAGCALRKNATSAISPETHHLAGHDMDGRGSVAAAAAAAAPKMLTNVMDIGRLTLPIVIWSPICMNENKTKIQLNSSFFSNAKQR